jgi:hypothetical protein
MFCNLYLFFLPRLVIKRDTAFWSGHVRIVLHPVIYHPVRLHPGEGGSTEEREGKKTTTRMILIFSLSDEGEVTNSEGHARMRRTAKDMLECDEQRRTCYPAPHPSEREMYLIPARTVLANKNVHVHLANQPRSRLSPPHPEHSTPRIR